MPIITLTISIEIPDGVAVDVKTAVASQEDGVDASKLPHLHDATGETLPTLGGPRLRWSEAEIALAEDCSLSDEDVAMRTGRTSQGVHSYRLSTGIIDPKHGRTVVKTKRSMARWTQAEIDFIDENYEPNWERLVQIGEAMDRTPAAVASAARKHLGKTFKNSKQ